MTWLNDQRHLAMESGAIEMLAASLFFSPPQVSEVCQLPTNPHIECELLFSLDLKGSGDWIKSPMSTCNDQSRSDDTVVAAGVSPPFIAQYQNQSAVGTTCFAQNGSYLRHSNHQVAPMTAGLHPPLQLHHRYAIRFSEAKNLFSLFDFDFQLFQNHLSLSLWVLMPEFQIQI